MSNQKTTTGTSSVIKSILLSIGATFAIIGTIEVLVYSGNGFPYFVIGVIFGLIWAIKAARGTYKRKLQSEEQNPLD
ncbi:MAG: hypothetical protein ACE5KA_03980 [Nitrososphaerales archaeon]